MENGPPDCLSSRDPQRVARRAMVLSAVVCRGNSDHEPSNPDAIALWERLKNWVDRLGLAAEMEPHERDMIYASLGTLDDYRQKRATWDVESLAIMAWALRCFPLPRHDEEVNGYEVTDALWFLNDEAADVIQSAELRPRDELGACRELLYAIHCRLRDYQRTGSAKDIAHWIESDWLRVLGIESPLGPQHDLRIGDVELAEADKEKIQRCEWAIAERHRAIIWLVGEEGPLYSDVTADT
jgi:hypothetical protein